MRIGKQTLIRHYLINKFIKPFNFNANLDMCKLIAYNLNESKTKNANI